jgi:hypothetical protein
MLIAICHLLIVRSPLLPCLLAADKLLEMVRPFTLRDLALVRRLIEQGISLHAESAWANELHPLRGALASLVAGGKTPTFIYKSEKHEKTGFIQLLLEENENHAHILYVSPAAEDHSIDDNSSASIVNGEIWLALLDEAVAEVGRLGIHSLVAEVDERGHELPIMRKAGFAVYTRQDIWFLDDQLDHLDLSTDDWDIQLLYANTVPQLVQLVEPVPPLMTGDGWVLRDTHDELAAFVHVREGSEATWFRFFIHPSAEADASDIIYAALVIKGERRKKPVYCCVRRYEGLVPAALERSGFKIWASQAVLVKHTVHHTRRTEPHLAVNLDSSRMPATSPFVRRYPIKEKQEKNE